MFSPGAVQQPLLTKPPGRKTTSTSHFGQATLQLGPARALHFLGIGARQPIGIHQFGFLVGGHIGDRFGKNLGVFWGSTATISRREQNASRNRRRTKAFLDNGNLCLGAFAGRDALFGLQGFGAPPSEAGVTASAFSGQFAQTAAARFMGKRFGAPGGIIGGELDSPPLQREPDGTLVPTGWRGDARPFFLGAPVTISPGSGYQYCGIGPKLGRRAADPPRPWVAVLPMPAPWAWGPRSPPPDSPWRHKAAGPRAAERSIGIPQNSEPKTVGRRGRLPRHRPAAPAPSRAAGRIRGLEAFTHFDEGTLEAGICQARVQAAGTLSFPPGSRRLSGFRPKPVGKKKKKKALPPQGATFSRARQKMAGSQEDPELTTQGGRRPAVIKPI